MDNSTDSDPAVTYGNGAAYDPTAPVPYWHQNMELATICITNALTLFVIIVRVWVRRRRLGRFRGDDIWVMVAGVLLVFPYWVSQIGTNRYGSGLHSENIPDDWLVPFWKFQWGWVGYYLVSSMIKVSSCACLLEILPPVFQKFRFGVYALCFIIMGLGIAEACVWLFQCQPFLSNFVYDIIQTSCIDIDKARYAWVGLSIAIDITIFSIPFAILQQVRLKSYEKYTLLIVFGANLLGTVMCAIGIYGIWVDRTAEAGLDVSYTETVYVMTNDIEIFMYAVGASATVFSRYFVQKAAAYSSGSGMEEGSEPVSWRRKSLASNTLGAAASPRSPMQDDPLWLGYKNDKSVEMQTMETAPPSTTKPAKPGKTPLNTVHTVTEKVSAVKKIKIGKNFAVDKTLPPSPPMTTVGGKNGVLHVPKLRDVGGLSPGAEEAAGALPQPPHSGMSWLRTGSAGSTVDSLHPRDAENGPIYGWEKEKECWEKQ